MARAALFTEWRRLLQNGSLPVDELMTIRGHLSDYSVEFEPGPDRDLLWLDLSTNMSWLRWRRLMMGVRLLQGSERGAA